MEENKNVKTEGTQEVETQSKETQEFDIKSVLENDEFKKFMESYADKRVSEAVKTTKKKLQQEYEEEKKKSEMTQEEILQQKERELYDRELKLEKIQYFKEKNYDLDLLDFVIGGDIDMIQEKADSLITTINKVVEKQVAERLKQGYVPPANGSKTTATESIGLKLAKQIKESQQYSQEAQQQYFK
ncbi:hypothetical protein CACET_c26970 [Clostridium aceticum]|uniref:Uncharacterized protein n=1 Tax=Clostridium aceticum TaxID=84022 RepID=A0A0D8I967_9CLOT|nr:DUF4355 domain-containing protein [Clostridium aceticum]AKL96142.1 hypothetical protein CACET_c26970 [Clostridium aceticum]KJF26567.1 hypothetical protein TZ02_11860 [Clostridium aceticum]